MSAGFTPWRAEEVAEVVCGRAPAAFVLGGEDGTHVIAEVHRARDARLIAAAPEMFEAGDELADKLWILRCESRDDKSRAAAEAAIEMWKAARAKASGGNDATR